MMFCLIVQAQKAEVEKYCFKDCGKILIGSGYAKGVGELGLCNEDVCPYMEKQMDESLWEIDTEGQKEKLYLRKLRGVRLEGVA